MYGKMEFEPCEEAEQCAIFGRQEAVFVSVMCQQSNRQNNELDSSYLKYKTDQLKVYKIINLLLLFLLFSSRFLT